VEVPKGEENETSSLCTAEKWWQGRGHWKQVRDQKNTWKTPKEKGMRPVLFLPEKWWQEEGTGSRSDQKTRWKSPKEKGMRPVLCVPEKWWHGRGHWKQVRDQKTRWKTPKEKGMRPVQVTRPIMTQVMLTPAVQSGCCKGTASRDHLAKASSYLKSQPGLRT
jgi:hypothetical protein